MLYGEGDFQRRGAGGNHAGKRPARSCLIRPPMIEVGAQTNTYEEALNAMEPLSELLDMVLQGNRKDSIIQ